MTVVELKRVLQKSHIAIDSSSLQFVFKEMNTDVSGDKKVLTRSELDAYLHDTNVEYTTRSSFLLWHTLSSIGALGSIMGAIGFTLYLIQSESDETDVYGKVGCALVFLSTIAGFSLVFETKVHAFHMVVVRTK